MPLKPFTPTDRFAEIEAQLRSALAALTEFRKVSEDVWPPDVQFPISSEAAHGLAGNLDSLVHSVIRERIRSLFPSMGKASVVVLLRLLESAGEYVASRDLAGDAGSRSASIKVVQVYICRLRASLDDMGFDDVIETGPGSYRLRRSAAPKLIRHLFDQ